MRGEDLVREGWQVARPSLELGETRREGAAVGLWGGKGPVPKPARKFKTHVLSVDCAWLRAQGFPLSGTLSVFADDWLADDAVAVIEPSLQLASSDARGGEWLWGKEQLSLPAPEGLCLHGSDVLARWLTSQGGSRTDGAQAVLHRTPEGDEYLGAWQAVCPLYRGGVTAVLGGWPMLWPNDDVYESRGRLLLWTFRDSEPWFEVWAGKDGKLIALPRGT